MRELTPDDLGILLSLFALLLITFGIDFRVSRKAVQRHHRRAIVFAIISLVGEFATAIALVLTWVALWSPKAWERIDDLLVLVPGSIAVLCAVALTIESVLSRVADIWGGDASPTARAKHHAVGAAVAADPTFVAEAATAAPQATSPQATATPISPAPPQKLE